MASWAPSRLLSMDQVAESVLSWLRKGGVPLEYFTAQALRDAGFSAQQGAHYLDPSEKTTNREIDVLAWLEPKPITPVVLVFECKAADDKPWVVLTTEVPPEPVTPIAGALAAVLADPAISEPIIRRCLPMASPHGFTIVEAHSDKNDRAHSAMEQVVSGAVGVQARFGKVDHCFAFPVLVTEAPLFRFEAPHVGQESVRPTRWERIRWNGAQAHAKPTFVDVVRRESLAAYLDGMRNQVHALQEELSIFTRGRR